MYIVYLKNNKKHSAWSTKEAAQHQVQVLEGYGYKGAYYEYDETIICDNGHYYV
jgi:hypothetical protein